MAMSIQEAEKMRSLIEAVADLSARVLAIEQYLFHASRGGQEDPELEMETRKRGRPRKG